MKLTQEQKRIKIAEACGLDPVDVPFTRPDRDRWFTPEAAKVYHRTWSSGASVKTIPDYFNDLNAMHEAEKHLTATRSLDYEDELANVVGAGDACTEWYEAYSYRQLVCRATAAQRAEAFGLTLNLWKAGEE